MSGAGSQGKAGVSIGAVIGDTRTRSPRHRTGRADWDAAARLPEPGVASGLAHEPREQSPTSPPKSRAPLLRRSVAATDMPATNRTLLQAPAQTKELRMPGGDAVGGPARVAPVVGELVTKARGDTRREWIAVDVPQHVQDVPLVAVGHPGSVVAGFPEVAATTEEAIQTHRGVPVQPVHDPREFIGETRLDQIVNMIAHHRDRVDASSKLLGRSGEGVKHEEPGLLALQVEGPIVAPHRHVCAATRTTSSRRSRHGEIPNARFLLVAGIDSPGERERLTRPRTSLCSSMGCGFTSVRPDHA